MNDKLVTENDALKVQVAELTEKLDSFNKSDADDMKKSLDEAVQDKEKIVVELKDANDKIKSTEDELKVFKDKEEEILTEKKDALKKHYPETAELFDKAEAEYINTKFDEIQDKKKDSKNIGSDMMGPNKTVSKTESTRFNKMYGSKVEKKEE